MTESPWTKLDINANLVAFLCLVSYTIVILLIKSIVFFLIYVIFLILYMVIGRYVTCRHCDYIGKPCPSWNMGIIGGLLYKRSEKKNFAEGGLWKLFILDILPLFLANLIPILLYSYYFFTVDLSIIDWILISIYMILLLITFGVHKIKGCDKCPIEACPLAPKTKIKKG